MPPRHSARYNDKSRIYAANSIYQWHFQHFLLEVSTLPLVPLFMSIGICHYTAFTVFSPAAVRYEVVTKAVDSGMSKAERYPLSSHRLLSVLPVKCSTNDADCICVWSCELSNQFIFLHWNAKRKILHFTAQTQDQIETFNHRQTESEQ